MTSSLITISIAGLLAGFIFSMPIAGPVSILITTNALKGRVQYCNLVNIGASSATFTYVFFAVFGLSKLFRLYRPAIPYLLIFGSIFLIFMGYRIFKTKIDFAHLEDRSHFNEKIKEKAIGGFFTGLIINFCNPTLFIGWLTSTFLVISFVTSLGINTSGLELFLDQNIKEIGNSEGIEILDPDISSIKKSDLIVTKEFEPYHVKTVDLPKNFHLIISLFYALFITAGVRLDISEYALNTRVRFVFLMTYVFMLSPY
jgi:threonine/homoserine/homoserine lactone efflux protein